MKLPLLLGIAIVLLITSCTGGGDTPKKDDPYHKGTDGLVMTFPPNVPPSSVYEDDTFNLLLRIENKGAFSVTPKKDESGNIVSDDYGVLLITTNPFYLTPTYIDANQMSINLYGKSPAYPNGDGDVQDYGFYVKKITGERESPETPILFTICYPYQTELIQDVCIDRDYYNTDARKKVCKMQDISLQGQGAPVVITQIKPRALKRDNGIVVEFLITIENKGKGNVITKDPSKLIESQCTAIKPERDDWNTLKIDAELMGRKLTCTRTELIENKAEVKCTTGDIDDRVTNDAGVVLGQARNFASMLYITLDYLYQESTSKTIKIERFST
jgi:hypothetical protein